MKKLLFLSAVLFCCLFEFNAQNLREEIILKGTPFKIFDVTTSDSNSETTKYLVRDSKGKKIEHLARIYDKNKKIESYLGIYRKNDSELHFIEFNQTKDPATTDQFVYSPDKNGSLTLIKKELNLSNYPPDLPPKFAGNKPIHPTFPGGEKELNKWINSNLKPILQKKSKQKKISLTLQIDSEGNAEVVNLNLLEMDSKTEDEIILKLKKMPKWVTTTQGYNVSGLAIITISL